MTSRLRGDSERSTLCEMVAVKPGRGLSCPQGRVPGVLQELLSMEPALVSRAASSTSHTQPWPRDPLRYHMLSPRRPSLRLGTGTPPRGPHLPALPPSPRPRCASGSLAGTCSGQTRHKAAGRPGEGILASPARQEVGQQNAAGAATRDNRVATVQSVIQQTATCRGTRLSPTDQQPNLTLKCLKLQHEQTHLHIWKQLALEAAIWKFSLVM